LHGLIFLHEEFHFFHSPVNLLLAHFTRENLRSTVPNFAGDARANLFFVYIPARAGDLADVVDTAVVTREDSSPRNAFFFG